MIWLVVSALASAATIDRVAAVVNDEPIALSEVYDLGGDYILGKCPEQTSGACVRGAEEEVLDAVIQRVLVRQTLDKYDLDVTSADIDRGIDAMVEQYGVADRAALRAGFEEQGVTWDLVREQVADEIRMMKFQENIIRPRITVTENDIEALYSKMTRDVSGAEKVEVEAFSVKVADGADRAALIAELTAVVAEINGGSRDWLSTVKERDAGRFAPRDGKMGTFDRAEIAPTLRAAVESAAPGQVAAPIDLGPEILVLRVVAVQKTGVRSLEEVREQLLTQIYADKGEAEVEEWYAQARREATIRLLLDTP